MHALSRDRRLSTAALLGVCAIGPAAILHFFGKQEVQIDGGWHFFGIGISAGLAWIAAVILTVVGARQRDGRAVLVGTAFSVMALILTFHGLATPTTASSGSPARSRCRRAAPCSRWSRCRWRGHRAA